MPNLINAQGIQIKTLTELRSELYAALRNLYGSDIYLGQDSPDAQMSMIYIQASLDILDQMVEVYNSFDPDKAIGTIQDQRYGLNGIQRKGGTNTITPVRITVTQATQLYGVNDPTQEIYTVEDETGNQFQLAESINLPIAGSYDLIFQAVEDGKIEVLPNTITSQVTVVIGVSVVNNPSAPISIGVDQESDPAFRIRRQISTAIASQGYNESLTALLYNINGIDKARVYENKTNLDPDSRGIPAHSIWVIVSGVYSDAEVANAIYRKRNAGAGMRGSKSFDITDTNGDIFVVNWDDVTTEPLFIEMVIDAIDPTKPVNIDLIRQQLPLVMSFDIGTTVNASGLACAVQDIEPNALLTSAGFALTSAGPFLPKISNTALNYIFTLEAANIIITPIQIKPTNAKVIGGVTPESRTFIAQGGFGTYTWSIDIDNSGAGGSPAVIDASGTYTPGDANTNVFDTIKVVDSKGNQALVQVEVIA